MAIATDQQMQSFSDTYVRPFAEQARALLAAANSVKASIDDIYARATDNANPAWHDSRSDPPHLLQSGGSPQVNPDDMLNLNAFVTDLIAWFGAEASWPVLLRACVRPLNG